MRKLLGFVALWSCLGQVVAQAPQTFTSADIWLNLQKLKVLGSVLYVAAHPDDENTRLLAYFSKERKFRTGYLSLTRGDGGQNLIGDEQGIALGLIRTQELLSARRIDGAEQFFTRAYDFGFSKSTEEALRLWNKEKILSDVVWVIRKFRPDVIITRFPPDNRAGHGHHSASAALAIEAFKAAADPKQFPEQLVSVQPWQAKRIMWNTYNFGGLNTQNDNQYKIDVGVFNPLLGKGYGELAAESRSQHKSQGFGVPRQRGSSYEYFSATAGDSIQTDIMNGVMTDWNRVSAPTLNQSIDSILKNYDIAAPSKIVPALFVLRNQINATVTDTYWRAEKINTVNQVIKAAMGLYFEAVASQQVAVTGDSLQVSFNLVNRSDLPVTAVKINFRDSSFVLAPDAKKNQLYTATYKHLVQENFISDQPYWLREQMDSGSFNVQARELIGAAENPVKDVTISYTVGEQNFISDYPLQYKYTDPVKGEIYQPVFVVPPIVVGSAPAVILNNLKPKHPQQLQISYKSYASSDTIKGSLRFDLDGGAGLKERTVAYSLARTKNTLQSINLSFDSLFAKDKPKLIYPWVEIPEDGKTISYNNSMRLIQYDHIPTVHYFLPNSIKVINDEINVVGKKIGYIPGSGDGVMEALKQMGYSVDILDENILAGANLSIYDAIITGVRAYNVKESLNNYYEKLMSYISQGGNLIVQYNTSSQIGPVKAKIGPYPFTISRTRITDERAIVKIKNPATPLLNYPNKISSKDFEGWVQERSIYHASNWDNRYETVFTMNDPGEAPDDGSLIMTKFGKGYFVYTGLVFFRELPAGVPGAYRLLANIIALNQKKGF
jgi:LmbE family N-acetylglucosaminyl deacetylase